MNVNLESLKNALKAVHKKHLIELQGKSGKSKDFEDGFLAGIHYVYEYMVPAFETVELDESTIVENQLEEEIESLKLKHKFGFDDNESA